jgi:hypothetical protein
MRFFFFLSISFSLAWSVYLSNKSCKECHKDIYNEYQYSYHSKGYFNDILHRKIADKISIKKYDCASCHMPASTNLKAIIKGTARPNINNVRDKDAVSCFYCHEIAYVKKSHKFNKNILSRQISGYKPSLYGSLKNPDENDKHSSLNNPIYDKNVCKGCHSHKRNKNDLLIYQAMKSNESSKECIKCHMPYIRGGDENINRRFRTKHRSHYFYGIHDSNMRKKSIDITLDFNINHHIIVRIKNKMGHPLIIQAAREMFVRVLVKRKNRIIWSNKKDKNSYFKYDYLKDKKDIVIPYNATSYKWFNNLQAKQSKVYDYKIDKLKRGDKISVSFYMIIAKKECIDDIGLARSGLDKPLLVKKIVKLYKDDR